MSATNNAGNGKERKIMIETLQELAQAYKSGPGGAHVSLLLADGTLLCWDCFRKDYGALAEDLKDYCVGGRAPKAVFVHEEGAPFNCEDCNTIIESEAGEQCHLCEEWGNDGQWNEEKEAFVCYHCIPRPCSHCNSATIHGVVTHEHDCENTPMRAVWRNTLKA